MYKTGYVGSDLFLHLSDHRTGMLMDRLIALHNGLQTAHMDKVISHNPGHVGIDCSDHLGSRPFCSLFGKIAGKSIAAVAMLIRHGQCDQKYIRRLNICHIIGDPVKKYRHVIALTLCNIISAACSDKKGRIPEVLLHSRFKKFTGSHIMLLNKMDIL